MPPLWLWGLLMSEFEGKLREFAEEQERFAPKYAICSAGRLGEVQKLGSHQFYEDRPPNWAWKGVGVFDREPWMSYAASVKWLCQEDADALDAILEKAWMYDDLCK